MPPEENGQGSETLSTNSGSGGNSGQAPDPRIKQLSDEAASWRTKYRDVEAQIKALQEQQTKGAEAAKATERKLATKYQLVLEAAKLKFADPDDAVRFADIDALEKLDDDKRGSAIAEAVKKVLESKPYLAGATTGGTGGTPGAGTNTSVGNPSSPQPLTREQIEGMSKEDINRNWGAVGKAMSHK